jgi:hypothetical protein
VLLLIQGDCYIASHSNTQYHCYPKRGWLFCVATQTMEHCYVASRSNPQCHCYPSEAQQWRQWPFMQGLLPVLRTMALCVGQLIWDDKQYIYFEFSGSLKIQRMLHDFIW